jgi:hypothetical protein
VLVEDALEWLMVSDIDGASVNNDAGGMPKDAPVSFRVSAGGVTSLGGGGG